MKAITRPLMRREEAALHWRVKMAEFIREHRVNAGPTQAELATALGVDSPQFISGIEKGRTSLPPEKLEKLAATLEIDALDLAKVYLRFGDPWVYRIIYGANEELDRELGRAPERQRKRRGPKPFASSASVDSETLELACGRGAGHRTPARREVEIISAEPYRSHDYDDRRSLRRVSCRRHPGG